MSPKIILSALAIAVSFASMPAFADGDAAAGEDFVKKRCKACHTWDKGGKNKVGPNLWNAYGRSAGTIEGFKYSKVFQESAEKIGTWDETKLGEYLTDPTAYLRSVSGDGKASSKMTFKVTKEDDRANVIAYLKTLVD